MIKAKCKCGHKVGVPDTYAGKRVKCAKCGGAISVPGGEAPDQSAFEERSAPVAAPARPRDHSPRSRRHQYEERAKSHRTHLFVALGLLFAVIVGIVVIVLANYDPNAGLPIASQDREPAKRPLFEDPAINPRGKTAPMNEDESFARPEDDTPIEITSTFDADANITTIQSTASPMTVGSRKLDLTIQAKHQGELREQGSVLEVRMRLKGDMKGLISGANSDEPTMVIDISGREHTFKPVAAAESDDRRDENGPEMLPAWVEYKLDSTTLLALKTVDSLRIKLAEQDASVSTSLIDLLRQLGM
ncbi:MAG: hypothetical protein WD768_00135 [Phycisphaeraceae bacterium]